VPRSLYEQVKIDHAGKIVWIRDLDAGGKSVTNDAENVVQELNERHPGYRVIYKDSMGQWDELNHDNGKFIGYTHARHMAP